MLASDKYPRIQCRKERRRAVPRFQVREHFPASDNLLVHLKPSAKSSEYISETAAQPFQEICVPAAEYRHVVREAVEGASELRSSGNTNHPGTCLAEPFHRGCGALHI